MRGNGHAIPSTPICIDMWDTKTAPQARVFFLTHFHADHIVGLNSSWRHPIYASEITCKLLIHRLKIQEALVKRLEVGVDHLIPLDNDGREMATVTLFDANHCPGSVMLLLSGYFGDILYTGDFRYRPGLLDDFRLPYVDTLYLDNTYCSPKCTFATRQNAIENILSQISECFVQSKRVFLGLDNLGKEDLLENLANERQCKFHVYQARKEIMNLLGWGDLLTDDKSATNIFVVPTNQISGKNISTWNNEMPTHAILCTARFCGLNFKPFSKFDKIHVVPYSNHSSYLEIKEFVKLVKPSSIIPIVSKNAKGMFGTDISDRADMSVFQKFLSGKMIPEITIPESVKNSMISSEAFYTTTVGIKRRKVARKLQPSRRKPAMAGIRYIVSEDSETDSDPEAIHFEPKKTPSQNISEFSSSPNISIDDSDDSDTWEVTLVTANGSQTLSQ